MANMFKKMLDDALYENLDYEIPLGSKILSSSLPVILIFAQRLFSFFFRLLISEYGHVW